MIICVVTSSCNHLQGFDSDQMLIGVWNIRLESL